MVCMHVKIIIVDPSLIQASRYNESVFMNSSLNT